MPCSMPRVGSLLLAALLLSLGTLGAGELSRPVPSDAQVTRFTRFNIRYTLRDIVADGVQKVEFYITEDMGRTWRLYGEDADRMSPMTVEVPGEGVYGFVCIATDRFGNRERTPVSRTRPETVIVVDRTPPSAKWLAPLQDVLGKGQALELKWETSDPYFGTGPVKIQYAVNAQGNHDRDAVWNDHQDKLSASGNIDWMPPTGESARYNFRLVAQDRAGNMAIAYNPATIVVDGTPPMITGVTPLRSNKLENDITVTADDGPGGSGVKEISLYTSDNRGGTWMLVKETLDNGESVPVRRKSGEPIRFTAPRSGEFALWPVAFDEAGNATSLPSIGVPGPYIMVIDTEKPQVSLSNSFLMGRSAVLANETRRVEWTAYDANIRDYSAVIHISLDNGSTWQELRSGLPANGSEIINFPFGAQSEEAKLKVTVADEFGNVGEGVSETFKLSNAATTVESVTPVGTATTYDPTGGMIPPPATPGSTPSSTAWEPLPGDGGTAPYIPLNRVHPLEPAPAQPQTQTPPVASPDPLSQSQTPPSFGGLAPTPYAPPATSTAPGTAWVQPGTTPVPAPTPGATPQYADPDMQAIAGESTASSIPNAMLGLDSGRGGASGGEFAPVLPVQQQPSAPATPPASPSGGWTPSPNAGTQTQQPAAPSSPWPGFDPAPPATAPTTTPSDPVISALPPPTPTGTDFGAPPATTTPVAPPPMSGTPSIPSTPDSSAPTMPGFDELGVTPPPLPPSGGQGGGVEMPPPAATDFGGLSLPGGGLQPPTLSAPQTTAPTPLGAPTIPTPTPPAVTESGGMRPPETSIPTPPAAPATEPQTALAPPPDIQQPMTQRPTNPRDLSNHLIRQSKGFQDEGRIEEAIRTATEALSVDDKNPQAFMQLSQLNARNVPPDFARAANLAKAAAELDMEWETWWNCAEVYYIWAHAKNREISAMHRSGQTPPIQLVDERNSTLSNAKVAINNAAIKAASADGAVRKKIANTQGLIAYLEAMTIPEPVRPAEQSGPAAEQYRQEMQAYKAAVAPKLSDAQPYFLDAMRLDGSPTYSETFHLGMIFYRLGNLERETNNMSQAVVQYQSAVRYLEEATTSRDVPTEGPREAYYMLAHCFDLISALPGDNLARNKELALRYWTRTLEMYPQGTPYHNFARQRIDALAQEMGL